MHGEEGQLSGVWTQKGYRENMAEGFNDWRPSYLTHRLFVNLLSITDAECVQNFSGSQQKIEIPKPNFTYCRCMLIVLNQQVKQRNNTREFVVEFLEDL